MGIFHLIIFCLIYLIPLLIIGLIIYFITRVIRERSKEGVKEKDWYLHLFLSKEDAVSQFFFLLSLFFLGVTLLAFNKDLGEPLSWRTILLLTSTIGLIIAYHFKVIYILTLSLIGLAGWWDVQGAEWIQGKNIKVTALFTGLLFIATLFYLLGRAHEKEMKFKRVSMVYSILGLIPITGALFFLSTKSGLEALEDLTKGASFFDSWEITLSLFLFLVFLIGILVYTLSKNLVFKSEAVAIGFLVLLFCIIALLPEQTMFLQQEDYRIARLSSSGNLLATIFNLLVLTETIGLVVLGHFKNENWLKKLGLLFVGLLFLVKLVEWRGNTLLMLMGTLIFLNSGLVVYLLIKSLGKSFDLQIDDKVYSILGVVPLTLFLFFFSSESGLKEFDFDIKTLPFFSYLLILTAIYLLLNLGLWIYFFKNKINLLKEVSFLLVFLFLLALIIFVFPHKNLFIKYNELSGLGTFWAIFFNIILFLEIIGILFLGYLNKKHLFINLSVVFVYIFIFVKYFDWFFTFLDKSIFFIGAGILLFVVGWLMEKGRHYLLSTIQRKDVNQINN